jgi:hypothetical protein
MYVGRKSLPRMWESTKLQDDLRYTRQGKLSVTYAVTAV